MIGCLRISEKMFSKSRMLFSKEKMPVFRLKLFRNYLEKGKSYLN